MREEESGEKKEEKEHRIQSRRRALAQLLRDVPPANGMDGGKLTCGKDTLREIRAILAPHSFSACECEIDSYTYNNSQEEKAGVSIYIQPRIFSTALSEVPSRQE